MRLPHIPPAMFVRYVWIGILVCVCVLSWHYVYSTYHEHKADIILGAEIVLKEIALPFHIARMSFKEPTEELPVPVYDVALDTIGDTWGAARSEGRSHEGVDIFAERHTPVFSATVGYVVRKNIGTRGGINIMTIGPGGLYYYYAHLERLAGGLERGTYVTPDTVLGYVGNSGNATTTPPHLHFGIYPAQWDAINPYPLLIDRWN